MAALLLHSQGLGVGVRVPKQTTVIAFPYALLTSAFHLPGEEEGEGWRFMGEARRAGWGYERLWLRFETGGGGLLAAGGHLSTSAERAGS